MGQRPHRWAAAREAETQCVPVPEQGQLNEGLEGQPGVLHPGKICIQNKGEVETLLSSKKNPRLTALQDREAGQGRCAAGAGDTQGPGPSEGM